MGLAQSGEVLIYGVKPSSSGRFQHGQRGLAMPRKANQQFSFWRIPVRPELVEG
jgi:hypothetical protein